MTFIKFWSSLFLVFFLVACGHPDPVAPEDSINTPPQDQSEETPPPQPKSSWRQAREDLAGDLNTNPPPPIVPIAPAQTLQESEPEKLLDAYIQQIVSFNLGTGSGFGRATMTESLLGPPLGGGQFFQSVDVVSLGNNGEIVLGFKNYIPIDGNGPDFIIFENVFQIQGGTDLFVEPAIVGVSQDGLQFTDFPCSLTPPYEGCAGTHTVFANPDTNNIDPRDPSTAGGDAFDLSQVGFSYVQFIRIRDAGLNLGGEVAVRAGQAGFDLDAVSIIHGARP